MSTRDEAQAAAQRRVDKLHEWALKRYPSSAAKFVKPIVRFGAMSKAKRVGEYHHTNPPEIRLNPVYWEINQDALYGETITHEFAHHIVATIFPKAKQAHGPEFRQVCGHMGLPGDTFTEAFQNGGEKGKHMRLPAYCPCGEVTGITFTILRRMEEGKPYNCPKCKGPIKLKSRG